MNIQVKPFHGRDTIEQNIVQQTPVIVEDNGIISQISQMFLDDSFVAYLQDIDPFFLSMIIKQTTLKNCMINSRASNTIMPFKFMKEGEPTILGTTFGG